MKNLSESINTTKHREESKTEEIIVNDTPIITSLKEKNNYEQRFQKMTSISENLNKK